VKAMMAETHNNQLQSHNPIACPITTPTPCTRFPTPHHHNTAPPHPHRQDNHNTAAPRSVLTHTHMTMIN